MDAAKRIGTGIAANAALRQPVAVIMTDRSVRCVAGMLGVVYGAVPILRWMLPCPPSVCR